MTQAFSLLSLFLSLTLSLVSLPSLNSYAFPLIWPLATYFVLSLSLPFSLFPLLSFSTPQPHPHFSLSYTHFVSSCCRWASHDVLVEVTESLAFLSRSLSTWGILLSRNSVGNHTMFPIRWTAGIYKVHVIM